MKGGFGTDKKLGSAGNLAFKTLLESFPNARTAFNSLPNAKLVSTTYTSNFAEYEESGGEFVVSKWNNLINDDQYLRHTNSTYYPAISTANSLSGKPSLRFLSSDFLGSVAEESGYSGRTIFMVTRQNVINTGADKSLLYDSVGDAVAGGAGSATQKGFEVGKCDSVTGAPGNPGDDYRFALDTFYRVTPTNYSGPAASVGPRTDFGKLDLFVWKQELDAGNRSLEVSLRDESLSSIFSETITPASLITYIESTPTPMTDDTWDGLFGGDGSSIPAAYLNICPGGGVDFDIEYYFISIYHSALSDADCHKVFSMIKNMYGL